MSESSLVPIPGGERMKYKVIGSLAHHLALYSVNSVL